VNIRKNLGLPARMGKYVREGDSIYTSTRRGKKIGPLLRILTIVV